MIDLENLIKQTKSLKLLYVEDNKDVTETTLFILEDLFDDILIAVDGKDGLNKFKNNKIDLVLTDIDMPNMDGLEMSKAIKQININQPIIVLTAITDIKDIKEANDIDIDSFIYKPISDINILFNKIEECVKKMNNNKELKEK